jgi:hypothetical protein
MFYEGELPPGTALDFEPAIFNLARFASLYPSPLRVSWFLLEAMPGKAHAAVHFHIEGPIARSPYRAPFGSFEFSEKIGPSEVYGFIESVEDALRKRGVTEIHVTNPPRAYHVGRYSLLETFLLNQKYRVTKAEVSAVIPVRERSFHGIIRHSERLRIRQSENAGLKLEQLPSEDAAAVHRFISACHAEKGYKISITENDFLRTVAEFPERFLLFAIFHRGEMCAAAVSILVNSDVVYNFLVNHNSEFNNLSPAVLLMEGIYEHCRQHDIGLLDLGTSALGGQPNFSLLDFKLRLGAIPVSKMSFYKNIG